MEGILDVYGRAKSSFRHHIARTTNVTTRKISPSTSSSVKEMITSGLRPARLICWSISCQRQEWCARACQTIKDSGLTWGLENDVYRQPWLSRALHLLHQHSPWFNRRRIERKSGRPWLAWLLCFSTWNKMANSLFESHETVHANFESRKESSSRVTRTVCTYVHAW